METIKEVIAAKKKLRSYGSHGNEYYKREGEFSEGLRKYMNHFRDETMRELTKAQLIDLISICSTHRPCALHSLLISFSKTSQFY